jgi:hypothetical protein
MQMGYTEKEIYPVVVNTLSDFSQFTKSKPGIYVINENSMIDIERIDLFDNGKVGQQSVNLEKMTGNARVLEALEIMMKRDDCAFFPGTLLRDFGGFYVPTLPVISKGKLVLERIDFCSPLYIDNKAELARSFGKSNLAKELETYIGPEFEGPALELNKILNKKFGNVPKSSLQSIKIERFNVLPIICNEMPLVPETYNGEPINLAVHCCDSLFDDFIRRDGMYNAFAHKMRKTNKADSPLLIVSAQLGSPEYPSITSKMIYHLEDYK